jgi:hypothetical protein
MPSGAQRGGGESPRNDNVTRGQSTAPSGEPVPIQGDVGYVQDHINLNPLLANPAGGIADMDPMAMAQMAGGGLREFQAIYNQTLNDAINSTMNRGQDIGNRIQGRYAAIIPGMRATNAEVSGAYGNALGQLNQGYGALTGQYLTGMGQIINALGGRLAAQGHGGHGVSAAMQQAAMAPIMHGSQIANLLANFQNSYQNQLAAGLASAARYGDIAAKGASLRGAEDATLANLAAQAQADSLRSQLAQGGLSTAGQIASTQASILPALLGVKLQAQLAGDPLARQGSLETLHGAQQANAQAAQDAKNKAAQDAKDAKK